MTTTEIKALYATGELAEEASKDWDYQRDDEQDWIDKIIFEDEDEDYDNN